MKACLFVNMYINGICASIQAGHALNRMWPKYYKYTDPTRFQTPPEGAEVLQIHRSDPLSDPA